MSKLTVRRPKNSRKKWYEISVRLASGKIREVAKFTHIGDAELFIKQLQDGNTVEEIFVD